MKLIKEVRVLKMLTNALFSQRQTVFCDYSNAYLIRSNEEKPKYPDTDELKGYIEDFDPASNKLDRQLANFLAGRELEDTDL